MEVVMDSLQKLLGEFENEVSMKLITENAVLEAQQRVVAAIRAGQTTGDYVKDAVLVLGLGTEDEQAMQKLQKRLEGQAGKIVMIVERWHEYHDVVYGDNLHLQTLLSFGVLTEPRFYVRLDEGVPGGRWYLQMDRFCTVEDDCTPRIASGIFLPKIDINHRLTAEILHGRMYYQGQPMMGLQMDKEWRKNNHGSLESWKEGYLHHLAILVGDEDVSRWARSRNEHRVRELLGVCELLGYKIQQTTEVENE